MIEDREIDALMESVAVMVRGYVSARSEELERKLLEEIRERISTLPVAQGERGEKGEQGDPGPKGDKGDTGDRGIPGEQGQPGERGERGEQGVPGERGVPGEPGLRGEKGEAGEKGDRGDKGERGDIGERGERGEKGIDGKDGRDGRDGIAKDGRDGLDGRDALDLDILDGIDPQKSYPARTYASFNGGLLVSLRKTTPSESIVPSEWRVIVDGLASIEETVSEDFRTVTTVHKFTSGRGLQFVRKSPNMLHRGVYEDGRDYDPGDVVAYSGSGWLCIVATRAKPGMNSDWRLIVKEGRRGEKGEKGDRGDKGERGESARKP